MTSHADFVQPPRIASWLVNLFTPAEEAESILGDLLEDVGERDLSNHLALVLDQLQAISTDHAPLVAEQGSQDDQDESSAAERDGQADEEKDVVDDGSGRRRVLTDEASLRVAGAGDIRSSSAIQGFRPSFQRLCVLCFRRRCDRTRHRIAVRWVYGRVGGQGKGDGCHDDAGSDPLRHDRRCIGMDIHASACGCCVDAMVMRRPARHRDWRSHRPNA